MDSQLVRWHYLSPLGLRYDSCPSDQITLFLVILGKGSKVEHPMEIWTLKRSLSSDLEAVLLRGKEV